jgi:hypothetical protein
MLETAQVHLKPGGLFFFDFWHGPGVLADPPTRRERTMEDDKTRVRRLAVPEHRVSDNVVVVNYSVILTDIGNGVSSLLEEAHSMRYWFVPELRYLARQAGFDPVAKGGWLRQDAPGLEDWNAWMAVRI